MTLQSEIAAAIEDMEVDITVAELTRLIKDTDTDGSGELDSQEFAHMLSAVTMKKHADNVDAGANRDLCVTLSIFCAFNDSWSYFESIYFCIITLTTIGVRPPPLTPSLSLALSLALIRLFRLPRLLSALSFCPSDTHFSQHRDLVLLITVRSWGLRSRHPHA